MHAYVHVAWKTLCYTCGTHAGEGKSLRQVTYKSATRNVAEPIQPPQYENVDFSACEGQTYETVSVVGDSTNSYVSPPHSEGMRMEICSAYSSVPHRK